MNISNKSHRVLLQSLNTPEKIQNYLDSIPFNHEKNGETCRSATGVITHKQAHCLEGAFLACTALSLHKRKPQIVSLKVRDDDYDHVITIFKEGKYFGAISKTNHAVLRWRDPIYTSIRELVMSYFHEYFLVRNGEKTLRGYSRIINLNRFGTSWATSNEDQFSIAEVIADAPYTRIVPKSHDKYITKASYLERSAASITTQTS